MYYVECTDMLGALVSSDECNHW